MFLPICTLDISCQPFLACQVSVDRCAVNLMFLPLYVRNLLSWTTLRIFSLSLKFASFTIICQSVDLCLVDFGRGPLCLLDRMPVSFPRLGKFSAMICSNILSGSFSLSLSPLSTPMILILLHFMASLISQSFPSWSISCFCLFSSASYLSITLSSLSFGLSSDFFSLNIRASSLDYI